MNELETQNSISLNTNSNNVVENDRKRKRVHINNDNMESANKNKQLKSNYYSILDNESEFECDESALSKYIKHVQEHNVQNDNNESQLSSDNLNLSHSDVNVNSQTNKTNQTNATNNQHSIENGDNQNKNTKIPPIHVFDVKSNELISFIETGLNITEFKIKELKSKTIIYLNSIQNYVRLKSYLEISNTKFFTYTPKCIKTKTFLLKGLNSDIAPSVILDELCKLKKDQIEFVKVNNYYTNKSKREGYGLPIFLVQISSDSNSNQLKSIRGLLHRCIKWEPLRKPEIQQCRRCQGFFHSASNCHLARRCVKCGKQHDIGKCPLSKVPENERDKLFCVLCNKNGHPASYRGCEKYKELQRKIREKRQTTINNKKPSYFNINPNTSYANILKSNGVNVNACENSNNNQFGVTNNTLLEDIKNSLYSLSNQIINFQKQLEIQAKRIDTLFSLIEG